MNNELSIAPSEVAVSRNADAAHRKLSISYFELEVTLILFQLSLPPPPNLQVMMFNL